MNSVVFVWGCSHSFRYTCHVLMKIRKNSKAIGFHLYTLSKDQGMDELMLECPFRRCILSNIEIDLSERHFLTL